MNPCLAALLSQTDGLSLCWLGNDSWLLWDGTQLAAIDLDLGSGTRLFPPPVTAEELAPYLDFHLITHAHDDHFNILTCKKLAGASNCLFILPNSCRTLADSVEIPPQRRIFASPGISFDLQGMLVIPTRALHGHLHGSVYAGASFEDCGYRLLFGGKSIYEPGDTVLLQEQLEMDPVDVLFVSPTEHNTQVENSLRLIDTLRPRYIFAQHFGTYAEEPGNLFWTHGYPNELAEALSPEQKSRYRKPVPGEIYSLI
jgi:L-ascorbate 6-phosphate lactonase